MFACINICISHLAIPAGHQDTISLHLIDHICLVSFPFDLFLVCFCYCPGTKKYERNSIFLLNDIDNEV